MHDLLRDLKNLKEQLRVSTDTLAERSRISRATIARLWADDADPRLETMVDVAKALGATLILSTSTSRQAFNENDVRPYRELLAEKERIIAAKEQIIMDKDKNIADREAEWREYKAGCEAWKRQREAEDKKLRRWLTALAVISIALVAALIADLFLHVI